MTYSSPNYQLVEVPSRLAFKYRLFRFWDSKVGRESARLPVLFVPGNRGSFEQVRSIGTELDASIAVYSIDFQEEFVGGCGVFLAQQTEYVRDVLLSLSTLYPGRNVTVVGHSMGGVAALGNNALFSSLVLVSSPVAHPVVGADLTMRQIYASLNASLNRDLVVASVAGGQRDWLVPPSLTLVSPRLVPLNRTVHALARALGGKLGTSADHQAVVWCNQIVKGLAAAVMAMSRGGSPEVRRMAVAEAFFGTGANNESVIAQARGKVLRGESPLGVSSQIPESIRKMINAVKESWPRVFPALVGVAIMLLARSSPSQSDDDVSRAQAKRDGTVFTPLAWLDGNVLGADWTSASVLLGFALLSGLVHGPTAPLYCCAAETLLLLLRRLQWALMRALAPLRARGSGLMGGVSLALLLGSPPRPALGWTAYGLAATFTCLLMGVVALSVILPCAAHSQRGDRAGMLTALSLSTLCALPALLPHLLVARQLLVGGPEDPEWARKIPQVRGQAHLPASSTKASVPAGHGQPIVTDVAELVFVSLVLVFVIAVFWRALSFTSGRDATVEGKWATQRGKRDAAVGTSEDGNGAASSTGSSSKSKGKGNREVECAVEPFVLPDGSTDYVETLSDLKYLSPPQLVKLRTGEVVQVDSIAADFNIPKLAGAVELRFGADVNLAERVGRYVATLKGPWSDATMHEWAKWSMFFLGAAHAFLGSEEWSLIVLASALLVALVGRKTDYNDDERVVVL